MQENRLSPFHTELLDYLQKDVEKRLSEEGILTSSTPEFQTFFKGLHPNSQDERLSFEEILKGYQTFVGADAPVQVEKGLIEAFVPKDFIKLGLSRYYPRMYRGLPRLYNRDNSLKSQVKKSFTNLASLKKQAATRALYSLYNKLPVSGKVTLFTWVLPDGLGDYMAGFEIFRLLKTRLPQIEVSFVAIVSQDVIASLPKVEGSFVIAYTQEKPFGEIPEEVLLHLRASDLILQVPTVYPETTQLMNKLEALPGERPVPKQEFLGEYGFLESSWFHPHSGGYSMGLHFLEKGILVRKKITASWDDVKNERLQKWINRENRFYLAYLATPTGGAIYLHSLLKSLENDSYNIDICTPDLGWFADFLEGQKKTGKPVLEWDLDVASIDVYFQDHIHSIYIAPQGKRVRLLSPGLISQSDFRVLLALSGEWVAIRGNQSFSEVVSQGKTFFYDGREHSRYFVKDLLAIAENRISAYPSSLSCLRAIAQGFLYNLPVQEGEWVDETFFQPVEDWTSLALQIGLSLQDPAVHEGYAQLNKILIEEFSANSFICHLVQRALCHRQHPKIEKLEREELLLFINGAQSFSQFITSQKEIINSRK